MYHLKAAALLGGPIFLMTALAAVAGGRAAWWLVGFLSLTTMALLWLADLLVLRRIGAKRLEEQAAPGLFGIVRTLARRQYVPMPAIYMLAQPFPNALGVRQVTGTQHIVLTAGLLEALTANELAAVIAHELSFLEAGAASLMTLAALYGCVLERIPLLTRFAGAFTRLTTPTAARYRADAASAHLIGDAAPLMEALKKIADPAFARGLSSYKAVQQLFIVNSSPFDGGRSNPALSDRLLRLESLARRSVAFITP